MKEVTLKLAKEQACNEVKTVLEEVLREGARKMLLKAIDNEVLKVSADGRACARRYRKYVETGCSSGMMEYRRR